MLSMAYLGRLLTDWVPQERHPLLRRALRRDHPGARASRPAPARSSPIDEVDGERRATLDLAVTLADGTVTLTGDAVVALA